MRSKYEEEIQVKAASTVEEMRAEIYRLSFRDPLVRNIMQGANYRGLSGEDACTILAYNALRERAVLIAYHIQSVSMQVVPRSFVVTPPEASE